MSLDSGLANGIGRLARVIHVGDTLGIGNQLNASIDLFVERCGILHAGLQLVDFRILRGHCLVGFGLVGICLLACLFGLRFCGLEFFGQRVDDFGGLFVHLNRHVSDFYFLSRHFIASIGLCLSCVILAALVAYSCLRPCSAFIDQSPVIDSNIGLHGVVLFARLGLARRPVEVTGVAHGQLAFTVVDSV